MRYSTQSQQDIRLATAEGCGRSGRQSVGAVPATTGPHSANDAVFAPRPGGSELLSVARAHRARRIAGFAAGAWKSLAGHLRRLRVAYERHQQARITCRSLRGLDARTLRDIGFDRSEIGSVPAEAAGLAAATRIQVLQTRPDR